MSTPQEVGRWQDYVLERGAKLAAFLQEHLSGEMRDVLFVLGRGFDPRMCVGLDVLLRADGEGRRDVLALALDEGTPLPADQIARADANWIRTEDLVADRGTLTMRAVHMLSKEEGRRIGPHEAANAIHDADSLAPYTDIIVDISALPRSIYFPLLTKILHLLDTPETSRGARPRNLFVFAAENPTLDARIRDVGVDEKADYLYPFRRGIDREATAEIPKIWVPLLGEGQGVQLERIHTLVDPAEIAPVLPSPSRNPRRGDDMVLEYHELLFDRLRVEPRNIIYASEHNPFDVYRQIRKTILSYARVLEPLGGCKAVLSSLSTKLMSVGAFLVAYEFRDAELAVGVAHVESLGYELLGDPSTLVGSSELFGLWLAGECYEP